MWELYDTLIEDIPADAQADEFLRGSHYTMVRCGNRIGLAMEGSRLAAQTRPWTIEPPFTGMKLRDMARAAKSWNFVEASVGIAAIGAWYNMMEHEGVARAIELGEKSSFADWRERARGKKVAVIGHFPGIEQTIGDVSELFTLEKFPVADDYPDSACEYLLPEMDLVFATGVTLINKTLPRLLELSRKSGIILVGPSVPLAPALFNFNVRDLQGFIVTDTDKCRAIISGECSGTKVFASGTRVSLLPPVVPVEK
jgi:uncharacterized protein (DUF4213/DUF364 family)